MKKSFIRTLVILAFVFVCVFTVSCKKHKTHTYENGVCTECGEKDPNYEGQGTQTNEYKVTLELNGGSLSSPLSKYNTNADTILPTPTKEGNQFLGWYSSADFSGSAVSKIAKGSTGDKTFYAKWGTTVVPDAKWPLNQIGFNGNLMEFNIKVLPVSDFDPFNGDYNASDKSIKQAHMSEVESAYNIDIEYVAWGDDEKWGPDRVKMINTRFVDGTYKRDGVYVVNISSQWIPTLVQGKSLAELYNYGSETGIFKDAGYEQNSTINETLAVNKKVYGYEPGSARPDYFLYYNATKVALLNLEDPAELWLTGEWTWSKFDAWVRDAQSKLGANEFAIDCGYAEFSIGAVAAQGQKMIDADSSRVVFDKSGVTDVFDAMQQYYQNGFWDKAHGVQDVSTNFKLGQTLLHTGSIWFLKESTRFTPSTEDGGIQFNVGMVPYPIADDTKSLVEVHTEPYTAVDSQGNLYEVTTPIVTRDQQTLKTAAGEEVYGVDYSNTSFKIPYTGGTCYSVLDFKPDASGMNTQVAFRIMYDLISAQPDNPDNKGLTNDELYANSIRKKLDASIDLEVIMSVQNPDLSYYELMEVISMTVGNGSHFQNEGYWVFASGLISSEDTPATKFKEIKSKYEDALIALGY